MLEFTAPVEHWGRKFDRGMILYEFDALREPEKTRFPQIGAWVRERCAMVEIPTPSMLWRGALVPDLYIANRLEVLGDEEIGGQLTRYLHPSEKAAWPDDFTLEKASTANHTGAFHAAFIEPMCRKITGLPSSEIAAKYHRAIWLPLYWPQTLRARQSIPTPFYYPVAGYAGALEAVVGNGQTAPLPATPRAFAFSELQIAYVVAAPRAALSVLFVVDESPIYRVTDMDACAGLTPEFHRYVVEYRGECNVVQELERLRLTWHARHLAFDSLRLTLPTIANVAAGWKPRPAINDQLLEHINAETRA